MSIILQLLSGKIYEIFEFSHYNVSTAGCIAPNQYYIFGIDCKLSL